MEERAASQVPFRFGIVLFILCICILPKAAAEKWRGVYFLRRNPPCMDKTILTTAEDGFIVHTSFVKCFEQDTTSPDHRFQRAVGGAKRQQGTGRPSPVSSRSERCKRRVIAAGPPPLTGYALRFVRAAVERPVIPASKVVTRKLRSAADIAAILAFVFAMGFRCGKPAAEAGLFFLLPALAKNTAFFRKEREIT